MNRQSLKAALCGHTKRLLSVEHTRDILLPCFSLRTLNIGVMKNMLRNEHGLGYMKYGTIYIAFLRSYLYPIMYILIHKYKYIISRVLNIPCRDEITNCKGFESRQPVRENKLLDVSRLPAKAFRQEFGRDIG